MRCFGEACQRDQGQAFHTGIGQNQTRNTGDSIMQFLPLGKRLTVGELTN